MTDSPNQREQHKLEALTASIFKELYRYQYHAAEEGLFLLRYTDADTGRCFEVQQAEAGHPFDRCFISELAPSGETNELDTAGNVIGTRLEPLVSELEASIGPNGLISSLREAGVDISLLVMEHLPRPGQPRGFLSGLSECAASIAFLLTRNKRYGLRNVK